MCGIIGAFLATETEQLRRQLEAGSGRLRHRGPDAEGTWIEAGGRLGFAHRRLSILDLSAAGNQPMTSASGRYVICYNGEVYNFQAIRAELEAAGRAFRGHSDTEVILAAIEAWGLAGALPRFTGMFAFALWDAQQHCVYLVRDRLGVKPLYYGWRDGQWAFASELKALYAFPILDFTVSPVAASLYLRYGYVPAPWSIYNGVRKLMPGSIVRLDLAGAEPVTETWWDPVDIAEAGQSDPHPGSDEQLIEELETLLDDAVRLRMIADVPVGAFLSGGIDSSTVVALMRRHSAHPVRTFTIGFREDHANEAVHAKRIAAHLGTQHEELYIGEAELLRHVDEITDAADEPFADSSILPTWILSRLTAAHVKVALSGDGGDEMFGGYTHYQRIGHEMNRGAWLPMPLRKTVGGFASRASAGASRLARTGALLQADTVEAACRALQSHWQRPGLVLRGGVDGDPLWEGRSLRLGNDARHYLMLRDLARYLPDDILVKVDRASMAHSLECRGPLLDHRIAEFAWRLPVHARIRDGQGKWLLRQVLRRHVPASLFERPKQGFGAPISRWLRGELRGWAEDLLHDPAADEFFDGARLRHIWDRRMAKSRTRGGSHLWDVLVFLNWIRRRRAAGEPASMTLRG